MIYYKIFRGNVMRVRSYKNSNNTTAIKKNKILHNRQFIGLGFTR